MLPQYDWLGGWYDALDYPWERQRAPLRRALVHGVRGTVMEWGVGTGRNLPYYHASVRVTGIDASAAMLRRAAARARNARCTVALRQGDITSLPLPEDDAFDWLVASFVCCVLPDAALVRALAQVPKVLKPEGTFRFLEMGYAHNARRRCRQARGAWWARALYGVRLERDTVAFLSRTRGLRIVAVRPLDADGIYRLIEGVRTA